MSRGVEVVLSLGSNIADRRVHLQVGLDQLEKSGFSVRQVSPVVESPAQLPPGTASEWNRPYLNLVALGHTQLDIESFYRASKKIQLAIGPRGESKWAPRKLDIDIVAWGDESVAVNGKTIPHSDVYCRPFVLSPLVHMAPEFGISESSYASVFDQSCALQAEYHVPLWMGIINVTPDSFSDGGKHMDEDRISDTVNHMIRDGVNIIDVGAESTRPNATPVSASEEWRRLEPALEIALDQCGSNRLGPQVSVDTYRPETAVRALGQGVEIVNDVGGLSDESMIAIARECNKSFIAMHSVTLPVDPSISIDPDADACAVFERWIRDRRRLWESNGLNLNRIVVDPGIGFGKSSLQSLNLMRSVNQLRQQGHRVMIGHSRKRFLKSFSNYDSPDLDYETVGASLHMCSQFVDILRVHDVGLHTRAYLSWAHLLADCG